MEQWGLTRMLFHVHLSGEYLNVTLRDGYHMKSYSSVRLAIYILLHRTVNSGYQQFAFEYI